MNFSTYFTSQKIFGAISSEKLPIMILVSKSWIRIADNLVQNWKKFKRKKKKTSEIIWFLLNKKTKAIKEKEI